MQNKNSKHLIIFKRLSRGVGLRGMILFFLVITALSPLKAQELSLTVAMKKNVFKMGEEIQLYITLANTDDKPFIVVASFDYTRIEPDAKFTGEGDYGSFPIDGLWSNQHCLTPFGMDIWGKLKSKLNKLPSDTTPNSIEWCDSKNFCGYAQNLLCLMPGMEVGIKDQLNRPPSHWVLQPGKYKIRCQYEVHPEDANRIANYLQARNLLFAWRTVPNKVPVFSGKLVSQTVRFEVVK